MHKFAQNFSELTMLKLSQIETFIKYCSSPSDDVVDKMHSFFTTSVLLFFAILIGTKQTFGTPMQCIVSASFPGEWNSYVDSYCFVSGTYVSLVTKDVMPDTSLEDHEKINIGYYQWVPYILVCQGLMFFLPHLLWSMTQKLSDIDFDHVVEECGKLNDVDEIEKKEALCRNIAEMLFSVVKYRHSRNAGALTGAIGLLAYFFSKIVHLTNVILQLAFLYYFVGQNDIYWGYNLVWNGLSGTSWNETGYFQRVSFCDFRQNHLGGTHDYTVQCLLMTNMFNEKLFVLLYFWYLTLIVVSVINLFYVGTSINNKFWMANGMISRRFLFDVLGMDGELLVYFMRNRTNMLNICKIINRLYEKCTGFVEEPNPHFLNIKK